MIFFKILFYCQLQAVTTADEEHNSIKIKSFMLFEIYRRKFSLFFSHSTANVHFSANLSIRKEAFVFTEKRRNDQRCVLIFN